MMEARKQWIEVGYELFAREGPKGIKAQKLAKILKLNKSGFYHYFGDREGYFSNLLEYHDKMGEEIFQEISLLRQFDPDYYELLLKFKTSLMVQMQLRKHSDISMFKEAFLKFSRRNDRAQLHLWASYLNIADNQEVANAMFVIARDAFYTRLINEDMNLELIRSLIRDVVDVVARMNRKVPVKNAPPSHKSSG